MVLGSKDRGGPSRAAQLSISSSFSLNSREDAVSADRLHHSGDILTGNGRSFSAFCFSGRENEIVYGDHALKDVFFIYDWKASDSLRFIMSMAVWTSSDILQVYAFPETVSQTVISDGGRFLVAVAMHISRSVIMPITLPCALSTGRVPQSLSHIYGRQQPNWCLARSTAHRWS